MAGGGRPGAPLSPVDPDAAGRGDRTPAGWVWPEWLEAQLDPQAAAFVAADGWPAPTNLTGRNWTTIGVVASGRRPVVDRRGLVTATPGAWSLDWWIGADDRWHFPSRDHGVRQRLVGGAPVVETAMRVPGGDAVHRAYAVRAPQGFPPAELAVVEVHNQTSVPFAVALAVRPYHLEGLAPVGHISLDRSVVTVDGRVGLLLDRPPRLVAGSTWAAGDSATQVAGGAAHAPPLPPVRCGAGLAQAAFLYPLAHGAILRVALPLGPDEDVGRPVRPARPRRPARPPAAPEGVGPALVAALPAAPEGVGPALVAALPAAPEGVGPALVAALPAAASAARAWQAQTRRGLRVELPAGRLADAVDANRRSLLLLHRGAAPAPAPDPAHPYRDGANLVVALDRFGFHAEAAELLTGAAGRQRRDGALAAPPAGPVTTATMLWAMAEHWRLTGDHDLAGRLAPAVARAARWMERASRRRSPLPGLRLHRQAASDWAAGWAAGGLVAAATLLAAAGETDAAAAATGAAEALGDRPASPWADPAVDPGLDDIRARGGVGPPGPSAGPDGRSPYLTARMAAIELERGDARALARLQWLLDVASPTWTWPGQVDARTGRGRQGSGHDGGTGAAFCSLVRDLLVAEGPEGPVLLRALPDGWAGQGIEVHHAPTHFGRLSYAVRWHGDRPALLWELATHPGSRAWVRLTAPGLDRGWSTTDAAGEALLDPVRAGESFR